MMGPPGMMPPMAGMPPGMMPPGMMTPMAGMMPGAMPGMHPSMLPMASGQQPRKEDDSSSSSSSSSSSDDDTSSQKNTPDAAKLIAKSIKGSSARIGAVE